MSLWYASVSKEWITITLEPEKQLICYVQALKWSALSYQLWYSFTIKKLLVAVKPSKHIRFGIFVWNSKKMDFCRRKTLELPMWEPLMLFLREFWNELKNLNFLHGKTLCWGSYLGKTVHLGLVLRVGKLCLCTGYWGVRGTKSHISTYVFSI